MKTSSPAEHKDTVPTGEAGVAPIGKDWFSEYMRSLSELSSTRCALSFIEGYTRTALEYPDQTEWARHMTEIHEKAKSALGMKDCDSCGEMIPPHKVEACTHVPPDYMPEDFRKRATVVLCEACTPDEE